MTCVDLPAQVTSVESLAVAPPPKVPLQRLSTLTWRGFVAGVRTHTVELPRPWSYPEDRIHHRPSWRYSGSTISLPFTDNTLYITPNYALFPDDVNPDDVLILYHPPAILSPGPGDRRPFRGYAIGPFYVAIHFSEDHAGMHSPPSRYQWHPPQFGHYPQWHAVRPPDAPPGCETTCFESATNHPNLMPEPCYGEGDWIALFKAATSDRQWGEVLFIIHRFLSSWNPDDHPMGHPNTLCHAYPLWTGPSPDELFNGIDTVFCLLCGDCLSNIEDRYSTDDTTYCETCFYERYFYCESCGGIQEQNTAHSDSYAYCNVCLQVLCFRCADCLHTWEERLGAQDTNYVRCNTCFSILLSNERDQEGVDDDDNGQ